ncbi:hypothetical protein OROGR_026715 [Orobanche gracilis]
MFLSIWGYEVNYVRTFTDVDDKILDNGYAYAVGGAVYFSIYKFLVYGQRVAVNSRKRNTAKFALWKVLRRENLPGESVGSWKALMAYRVHTLHDWQSILAQHDEAGLKDSIPSEIAYCINKFQD